MSHQNTVKFFSIVKSIDVFVFFGALVSVSVVPLFSFVLIFVTSIVILLKTLCVIPVQIIAIERKMN